MKLLVYMRDGRTVFALRGRSQLAELTSEKSEGPAHERPSIDVVRGESRHAIAKSFGVTPENVSAIGRRLTWRHV